MMVNVRHEQGAGGGGGGGQKKFTPAGEISTQ